MTATETLRGERVCANSGGRVHMEATFKKCTDNGKEGDNDDYI